MNDPNTSTQLPLLQYPNDRFYERYGTLEEPDSQASRAQFLLVRHAVSDFNVLRDKLQAQFVAEGLEGPELGMALAKEYANLDKHPFLIDA